MKRVLIIVDMLNDFVIGKLNCKRSLSVITPIHKLLQRARLSHVPVIYANDEHHKQDVELKLWGNHAIKGTNGAQVISQLKPTSNDYIIPKRNYSAFFNTNLHPLLQKLKVDTLIVVGIYTDLCVAHTIGDAYQWGYKIIIPKDATNTFTKQKYLASLKYFKENYNAQITTVDEIVKKDLTWNEN